MEGCLSGNARFCAYFVDLDVVKGFLLQQQKSLRDVVGNRAVPFDHHVTFSPLCHILPIEY